MEQTVTCPYCGEQTSVEIETIENDYFEQHECGKCHKIINVRVNIMIDFEPEECPCQMVKHEWVLVPSFPKCTTIWRCKHCGETKPLTDDDRKQYDIPTYKQYMASISNEHTPF
ncbi:MAG: hypothetical protein J6Z01_15185 [Bacteroidales bacterium]|nr:hypothetical protein [Bacteroidales bacterium]